MSQQNNAIQQIDQIYNIIKGNLKTALSSSLMIANGACIMLIPLIEFVFSSTVDPYFIDTTTHASAIIFALRTIFYWTLFGSVGRYFKKYSTHNNILRSQLFQIIRWFPLIPIATGAALGTIGNGDLATPIVLILIGTLFTFFGQFSSPIVSTIAWTIVATGIIGIFGSSYAIAHLWIYMLLYLGFSFIVMGYALRCEQKNNLDTL